MYQRRYIQFTNLYLLVTIVAQGWSFYLQSLLEALGVKDKYLPSVLFGKNLDDVFTINIISGVLIIIMTILLMRGIRESATFTNFITVWNILLILTFCIAGCFFVDTDNWFKPCDNHDYDTYCNSGISLFLHV